MMAETENSTIEKSQCEIVIYQTNDGGTKIDVRLVDETVWLTQQQMSKLFQTSRSNVVEHIRHIYEEGELDEVSTCRKFRQQVREEGNRKVARELPYYNLDMIISLGYRVKSIIATNFCRWAILALSHETLETTFRWLIVMKQLAKKSFFPYHKYGRELLTCPVPPPPGAPAIKMGRGVFGEGRGSLRG